MNTPYDTDFYKGQMDRSLRSAQETIPYILELFHPTSVVDVGCGVGTWLRVFADNGITDILGIDGEYVNKSQLKIDGPKFMAHDLTQPINIDKKFDIAMSLEVAEHLPENRAENFVATLTSLAPVVIFSAAIPFQGGTHHINEQWQSYWASFFEKKGYVASTILREKIWDNKNVVVHYKQNIVVYVKKASPIYTSTNLQYINTESIKTLDVVHPERYLHYFSILHAVANAIRTTIKTILGIGTNNKYD